MTNITNIIEEAANNAIIVSNGKVFTGDYWGTAEGIAEDHDMDADEVYEMMTDAIDDATQAMYTHRVTWTRISNGHTHTDLKFNIIGEKLPRRQGKR